MAEHKVALITDTHFGMKKGNQIFHDYFEKFYSQVFFPYLEEHNITEVVHLGDCFDVRKGIDYWSLDWAKRVFFDPLRERGIKLHLIVGNHDIFYKTSLKINAPYLNLAQYDNIQVYDQPTDASINGVDVAIFPWICDRLFSLVTSTSDQPEGTLLTWATPIKCIGMMRERSVALLSLI